MLTLAAGKSCRAAILAALFACALAARANDDPCEPHRKRYGLDHPLTIAGALAVQARESTPTDADMRCLEKTWDPNNGAIAAAATRTLLLVVSAHPNVAIEAATRRPDRYREWMADLGRYGLHDVNGEAALLRRSIAQLLALKPAPAQAAARQLLLGGLGAVQPFKLE